MLDEDEEDLPPQLRGGVAHRIATYSPLEDTFVLPNGFRRPREPTVRRAADVAAVTQVLVDCDWKGERKNEAAGPPIDYGSGARYTELGMVGITDFPHYHFDPEADEISASLPAFVL